MIRDQCSDSPSFLLTADCACVIANYRFIDLRNVYMFVHSANMRGIIACPRSDEKSRERGIVPYLFRICN